MGMNEIRERLTDEESKFLFDKKIESIVLKDEDVYLDAVFAWEKEWRCEEAEILRAEENKDKKIIIFGAGKRGRAKKLRPEAGRGAMRVDNCVLLWYNYFEFAGGGVLV